MDSDKTKQYLNQISRLDRQIQNKLSEIYQLKVMVCSITIPSDEERVRASLNKDKLGDTVSKIIDLENETNKAVEVFINKRKHIIGQIDGIANEDYYHILTMRYVGCNTFEDIAKSTNWSIRKVFTLHNEALKKFEKLYGNEYIKYS